MSLKNIPKLFKTINGHGIEYLLTYKLSQDHLEQFFSKIRSRLGSNNNPNAYELIYAYKRLLMHNEVTASIHANCCDQFEKEPVTFENEEFQHTEVYSDHDYIVPIFTLDDPVIDIVSHISGFIVFKLKKVTNCEICLQFLQTDDHLSKLT